MRSRCYNVDFQQGTVNLSVIREYVRGDEMRAANVHYLEYEPFEFTAASGKTWIVYGSPVSHGYTSAPAS